MPNHAMTATVPSTAGDQRAQLTVELEAELLADADTRRLELIVRRDSRTCDEATADELREAILAARGRLAEMEALAEFVEFLNEHGSQAFEDTPAHRLPGGTVALFYAEIGNVPTFIFPEGQPIAARLKAAREALDKAAEAKA
jgi:hypothetical protein